MNRRLIGVSAAGVLSVAILLGGNLLGAVVPMQPGQSDTITCPTELSGTFTPQEVTVQCAPSSSPTSVPTTSATASTPIETASSSPSGSSVPTQSISPSMSASPLPSQTSFSSPTPAPTGGTPGGPNPLSCDGYPEPRIFLETQDHWSPIPELNTLGHVHLGTCFPLGQTVSGDLELDIRVVMFENKGTLFRVKGQTDKSDNFLLLKPDITPPDGGERIFWFNETIDTTDIPDGMRQMRFYAFVEHTNGNTQTARSSWPLDIENGGTDSNVSGAALDVRYMNWYQVASPARNWGYIGPSLDSIPMAPVGDSFTVNVNCAVNGDSNSPAIDKTIIHIDAAFHAGHDGLVIYDGAPLKGDFTVDTSGLDPGEHRLSIRCQQVDGGELHEGIGVFPFEVAP